MAREKMFKNLLLQEKYTMFLQETLNAVEVDSRSGKYVVLKTVDLKGDGFWFLGHRGAIRFCRTNAASKSMDVERTMQAKYKVWEETKLKGESK